MRTGHLLAALALCRERLSAVERKLGIDVNAAALLPLLADAERAPTPLATTIGLERRAAVLNRRILESLES